MFVLLEPMLKTAEMAAMAMQSKAFRRTYLEMGGNQNNIGPNNAQSKELQRQSIKRYTYIHTYIHTQTLHLSNASNIEKTQTNLKFS